MPNGKYLKQEGEVIYPYTLAKNILDLYPIGSIYLSVNNTNPSEYFGGTWTQVSQGRCLFGAGTLSGNTYTAGSTVNAGLPNIDAKVGLFYSDYNLNNNDYQSFVSNPFYYNESESHGTGTNMSSGTADTQRLIRMNLSRANSIYGNSSTVQPNAFVVYMWQRTA